MPMIQKKVTIAANTTVSNVLAGDPWEFLSYDAQVQFGFNQSATGLEVSLHTGHDQLADSIEPLISATYPNNDEMDLVDLVGGGERMVMKVTNTTGGGLDLYYRILITPFVG